MRKRQKQNNRNRTRFGVFCVLCDAFRVCGVPLSVSQPACLHVDRLLFRVDNIFENFAKNTCIFSKSVVELER